MKPIIKLTCISIVLILLVSCQKVPVTPAIQALAPDVDSSTPTAPGEEPGEAESNVISPVVQFYESAGAGEDEPTYLLFITPWENDYPAQVTTICNGVEAYVVAGTNGIRINNHCILETNNGTGYAVQWDGSTTRVSAYAVLPDGSTIYLAPETKLQINLGEGTSEVILETGEILNNVAPQLTDRNFTVLAGDVAIEAAGTQYAVSLKGKQISVGVIDGRVVSKRCLQRTTRACTSWHQNSVSLSPGQKLSGEVGGTDWGEPEPVDFYNGDITDFPLISPALLNGMWYFGTSINGEHFDEINLTDSISFVTMQIEIELMLLEKEINFYNQLIGDQYKLMEYCNASPENCPVAEVIPTATTEPQQPATAGGSSGPSGKFPPFDQSSCFTRSGHLWCYPVAGSVDSAMAGEWDITAICGSYPGETCCAWLP